MKKNSKYLILLLTNLLILTSCTEDSLFNFIFGPQPKFIEKNQFKPGFNILGVIRPDSVGYQTLSMIHVEKVLPAIGDENDSLEVDNARVMVYRIVNNVKMDSAQFYYLESETQYATYKPTVFRPKAGEQYRIKCSNSELPVLTSETTVPNIPVIVNDNVILGQNSITFSIQKDPSASMYDVYLKIGDKQIAYRVLQADNNNTQIVIFYTGSIASGDKLIIYAYDENLTKYFTAANVFIKPNTYRPPFSNVENGYGCFGSMNLLVREL